MIGKNVIDNQKESPTSEGVNIEKEKQVLPVSGGRVSVEEYLDNQKKPRQNSELSGVFKVFLRDNKLGFTHRTVGEWDKIFSEFING